MFSIKVLFFFGSKILMDGFFVDEAMCGFGVGYNSQWERRKKTQ